MIGVGITVASACGLMFVVALLWGEIAAVLLAVLLVCVLAVRGAVAGLRYVMANLDERDDTYGGPDPKPTKRRAF